MTYYTYPHFRQVAEEIKNSRPWLKAYFSFPMQGEDSGETKVPSSPSFSEDEMSEDNDEDDADGYDDMAMAEEMLEVLLPSAMQLLLARWA